MMEQATNPQGAVITAPGVYDITITAYHHGSGISNSAINKFRKAPLHYWDSYLNPDKPIERDTPDQLFGHAVHTYILQPELFDKEYAIAPYIKNKGTKDGKKAWGDFLLGVGSRKILEKEVLARVKEIGAAVARHEIVKNIIAGTQVEKSVYWIDEGSGLLCKTRPDIWGDMVIADLKTTVSAAEYSFKRSIHNYGYYRQAAMMLDGIKAVTGVDYEHFINIALEKDRPYAIGAYLLDAQALELGRAEYKEDLKKMKQCFETNYWPSYGDNKIRLVNLPPYAFLLPE